MGMSEAIFEPRAGILLSASRSERRPAVSIQPMSSPSASPLPEFTRDDLARCPVIAESNQGVVYRVALGDRELAIKTPRNSRATGWAHRLSLRREYAAYCRLRGLDGIPACHGLKDGRYLVLDHIEARPFRDTPVDGRFFERLLITIRAMHDRGVAHGDLKRKSNLLVDSNGFPVLLDFGAAVIRRDGFHPLNRRLFEFMRRTDLNAWIKLKYGGYRDISPADEPLLDRSIPERILSRLRK